MRKKVSTNPPDFFLGKLLLFPNSFHSNRIGRVAGGKHRKERRQCRAPRPNDGNIPGMSVCSKQKMLILRERKRVGRRTGMNADRLHSPVIDAVQRNRVRTEVRDPQRAIVTADDAAHRPVANGVSPTHLVGCQSISPRCCRSRSSKRRFRRRRASSRDEQESCPHRAAQACGRSSDAGFCLAAQDPGAAARLTAIT